MKYFLYLSYFLVFFNLIAISEFNAPYYDSGLIEKNGVFDLNKYQRNNYMTFFYSYSTANNKNTNESGVSDTGIRLHAYFGPKWLQGFYFNGELSVNKNDGKTFSHDLADWWLGNLPFFGQTNLGFNSKHFSFKFGFQNVTSSDAIYNHLMIDDYSGAFFGYKSGLMINQYLDFEVNYIGVRWHQGPWYNGEKDYTGEDYLMSDYIPAASNQYKYTAKYGKSLYFHKLNMRPAPWIRFGLQEGAYFLGENINPYFLNPAFLYFASGMIESELESKYGSSQNTGASNLMLGLDFNIGFDGWRIYGEVLIDDGNGEYFIFKQADHPDRVAFLFGGELRGYLFDKYLPIPRSVGKVIKNFYVNFEYGITSKYIFSRDSHHNYEYVREEFPFRYYPEEYGDYKDTPDADGNEYPDYHEYIHGDNTSQDINRVGNFIGFMYGSNSDSLDIAIGWRNDLESVEDSNTEYLADKYFDSLTKKEIPERLLKLQFHYRRYRIGDERDVVLPFDMNEHFNKAIHKGLNIYDYDRIDSDGTNLRTGFIDYVVEEGNIFDFNIYSDVFKLSRFILGVESETKFSWITSHPYTDKKNTEFSFKFDLALILSW